MTDLLRNALHEAADEYPPVELGDDPWRRGRRARRRRQVGAMVGVVGAGALIVGLGMGGAPDLSMDPPPAAPPSEDAMLPDQLFDVPANLPDIADQPLAGPASLVYFGPQVRRGLFAQSGSLPIVVGAGRDAVRAVRSPGSVDHVELSPDGTRLALARDWRDDQAPHIVVIDLRTGTEDTFTLFDQDFGGERLVWTPDGEALAVTAIVTTDRRGGSGQERYGWLDLNISEWSERSQPGVVLAFSDDGRHELLEQRDVDGGMVVAEVDGRVIADLATSSTQWGAAFSPDGQAVALVTFAGGGYTSANPFTLEVFDATTGRQVDSVELGDYARAQLLGWGQGGLVIEFHDVERGMWLERLTVSESGELSRDVVLESAEGAPINSVSIARDYLDAEIRDADRPTAPFDWVPWLPWLAAAGIVALVLGWRQLLRCRNVGRRDVDGESYEISGFTE